MGYWLEDGDEKWLGDLATNKGVVQLREVGSPALNEFLEAGEADEELVGRVIAETRKLSTVSYIAEMLGEAKTPVFVTDGCGEAKEGKGRE